MAILRLLYQIWFGPYGNPGMLLLAVVLLGLLWWDHRKLKESFAATLLLWFVVFCVIVLGFEFLGMHVLWFTVSLPFLVALRKPRPDPKPVSNHSEEALEQAPVVPK